MKKRKRCNHEKFELWEEECFNPGTPLLPRGYRDNKVDISTPFCHNRPRSICRYSNMALRLLGQRLQIFIVSFVLQFPKETWIQRKNHQI